MIFYFVFNFKRIDKNGRVQCFVVKINVLFREPNFPFLPDLSQVQKVPRVISILVEVFPFFDI